MKLAVLAMAMLLPAACQPLPHPFEDDRPPAALLKVRDVAGIAIAPIEGEPADIAAKLGSAVADALLKRDIPASDKTASLGSYQLYGRLAAGHTEPGKTKLAVYWRLYDAAGKQLGDPNAEVAAPTQEWRADNPAPIAKLAELSAQDLAPLVADEGPIETAGPAQTRVAIRPVNGAPGDGDSALTAAITAVLKHQELAVVEAGAKADLYIDGEVSVAPVQPKVQHVKILWRVKGADGAEIGTVGQENDVPKGQLDGPWGDVAYNIAIAASEGLMQIVTRATGTPKS